ITCFSVISLVVGQSSRVLTGNIKGQGNVALQGASIFVENKDNRNLRGASTDAQGQYSVEVPVENDLTIVVACIGYISQRIPYTGQVEINVTLQVDDKSIEEVVVTGAGRSEEHTSELQSRENLVCRLL